MALNSNKTKSERRKIIGSFLFRKNDKTSIQLIKYSFVGGCAYFVDFGTLIILTELVKIHYLLSAAIAFILGLITNYILSIFWVFSKRSLNSKQVEFLVFAVIGLIGLGFNEVIIWFFTETTHFHYLISKIIATVFVFFWNFFARKKVLFS